MAWSHRWCCEHGPVLGNSLEMGVLPFHPSFWVLGDWSWLMGEPVLLQQGLCNGGQCTCPSCCSKARGMAAMPEPNQERSGGEQSQAGSRVQGHAGLPNAFSLLLAQPYRETGLGLPSGTAQIGLWRSIGSVCRLPRVCAEHIPW